MRYIPLLKVCLPINELSWQRYDWASSGMRCEQLKLHIMTGPCLMIGGPLKLVDKFTYLGNSVSSTDNDINTWLAKSWTAINKLSVVWKSDLTDKIKHYFFLAAVISILLYGCCTWTQLNVWRTSLSVITLECCELYWTSHGGNTQQNSTCMVTYQPSWKLSILDEPYVQDTTREVSTNS